MDEERVRQIVREEIAKLLNKNTKTKTPNIEEVTAYFNEINASNPDQRAEYFIDFYEARGWMIGKTKMKSWKAAARNAKEWEIKIKPTQVKKASQVGMISKTVDQWKKEKTVAPTEFTNLVKNLTRNMES